MRWGLTPGKLEGAGTPFNWPAAIGFGRQPFANLVSGAGALAAGPYGVQLGLFGWADTITGEVNNTSFVLQPLTTSGGTGIVTGGGTPIVAQTPNPDPQILGLVLPIIRMWDWNRCTPTPCGALVPGIILRAGMGCVLASSGDFRIKFPFGAQAGQQVYTDPATGVPYSGNPGGLVATPWTVMESACGCNRIVRISTFTPPFN